MPHHTALLILNVGSPKSFKTSDVRRYLRQFLNHPRVITLPRLQRWLLVNGIIAPFRAPKSAKLYKQLWTENGAPLVYYTQNVGNALQAELKNTADVYTAMCYGQLPLTEVLNTIKANNYSRLIVLPMFPHYASSSTGAAIEDVLQHLQTWTFIPEIRIVNQFHDNPLFINAFAQRIQSYRPTDYEHVLFSFHSLPMSHLHAVCPSSDPASCECNKTLPENRHTCYKAACYQTARMLANKLNLPENSYSVAFQSRMSKNWIQPYTDKLIASKARQGVKTILVVAPSFVTDCLETTIEIGFEYRKLFQEHGGQRLQLVESLNDSPEWIAALRTLISDML